MGVMRTVEYGGGWVVGWEVGEELFRGGGCVEANY
jgi:hypothetical protein